MAIQQHHHNPAPHVPVARAIAIQYREQQWLILTRLLCTSILGAALLTAGAVYARAETPVTAEEKTGTEASPPEGTKEVADGLVMPEYQDDRSTPQKLIESYYNAINRKEYTRAYSYYAQDTQEADFSNYTKGYDSTQSVTIKLGATQPDPGAGQIYWTLPVAIESTLTDDKTQVYTGCYTISMSNPAMQDVPPFKPMSIRTGTLSVSPKPLEESVPEECEAP